MVNETLSVRMRKCCGEHQLRLPERSGHFNDDLHRLMEHRESETSESDILKKPVLLTTV